MLLKQTSKNILFSNLNIFLQPKGFFLRDNPNDPRYINITENGATYIYFNFDNSGSIYSSGFLTSLNEIENIIIEIGHPNLNIESLKSKNDYFLNTLKNKNLESIYNQKYRHYSFKSEAEVQEFSDWLIHYLNTKGFAFVEHYSFLPNVLAKMNQLIEEGKYWADILSGNDDNLFRGLIISKLCNDNHFDKKMEYVEKIFRENPDEWLPYFEKLKEKLKTLEPKYNATDGRVLNFEDIV
ncbi:hypothetical protein [Cellulophaga lytica]|uniref:hypothetical protein n=1 Tax=Cellulophaga lytica TaxID=979 RepID=UPI000B5C89DD|nr:hypothetical protein [Cellulophaga lytica]MDO6853969.1 hypothetical protein [Cellulophaga lytica]SNQ45149.1 conserved hypothetical protein [Cellulophaga lytica]